MLEVREKLSSNKLSFNEKSLDSWVSKESSYEKRV